MHIAYFGSPQLSAKLLQILLDQYHVPVSLITTQQDRPVGKHLKIEPTPVKRVGLDHQIEVFDRALNQIGVGDLIQSLSRHKIELCIVFAYGKILSQELLDHVSLGFWNVHPSLLPRYRGPTPTVFPIIMGDATTGTTLIHMNARMDEGDILAQNQIPLSPLELREDIEDKLVALAGEQIYASLQCLTSKTLEQRAQQHEQATYTPLLSRQDGFIEEFFIKKALQNEQISEAELPQIYQKYHKRNNIHTKQSFNARGIVRSMFRALTPWPGLWTMVRLTGELKRLKIIKVDLEGKDTEPLIQAVQLEGKNSVEFATFCKAYSCFL